MIKRIRPAFTLLLVACYATISLLGHFALHRLSGCADDSHPAMHCQHHVPPSATDCSHGSHVSTSGEAPSLPIVPSHEDNCVICQFFAQGQTPAVVPLHLPHTVRHDRTVARPVQLGLSEVRTHHSRAPPRCLLV